MTRKRPSITKISEDQVALQKLIQKLSVAVEQTPAVVMITDVRGTIEYVNPAFEQVTGYTRSEAVGANPRILRSGQMPEAAYREMWATITAGQVWRGEFCNRKKNGELYWDLGTISPLRSPDGTITNYVSVKEDITERKKIEAELQQHRDYLETLVQARTAELTAEIAERKRAEAGLLEKERMSKELDIARKIQFSMLPKACPVLEGWQFAAFYQPARQIGGDFYDFIRLPQGRIGLAMADVVDKGVPAALTMSLSRAIVRSIAGSGAGPAAILEQSNQVLLNDQIANAFVTTLFASLDPASGQMDLANAGHNRPLWYSDTTGAVDEIKTQGMALGLYANLTIEQKMLEILPGDVLLFYTDGLTEAMNTQDEFYGEDQLAEVFGANHYQDAEGILDMIRASWLAFTIGTEQADDVSMVVVKRKSTESP